MKLILAIVKPFKVVEIVDAIRGDEGFPGMTLLEVKGFGRGKTAPRERDRVEDLTDFTDHAALLIASPDDSVEPIVARIASVAHTGLPGDGKIFVLDLEQVVSIRTGERDTQALV